MIESLIDGWLEDSVVGSQSLYDVFLIHHPRIGHPSPLFSITVGDVGVSRLLNYRFLIILHCFDLATDTSSFCPVLNRDRSSCCPLCSNDVESVFHFLVACPVVKSGVVVSHSD